MEQSVTFISWVQAGLDDRVMDWRDENLEAAMREFTVITDKDIMLNDVWERTQLGLEFYRISDISTLSGLTNLTELYLGSNQISDISVLSSLTNLTWPELQSRMVVYK